MDIVKCSKCGKFFDKLSFENCPTCGAKAGKSVTEKPKKGLFSFGKTESREIKSEPVHSVNHISGPSLYPDPQTLQPGMQKSETAPQEGHIGDTIGLWENNSSVINQPEIKQPVAQPEQMTNDTNSLSKELNNITASSAGKTVSYFDATMEKYGNMQSGEAVSDSGMSRMEITGKNICTEPVAGWLVCVRGKHFGHSFSLQMGKNTIGRDESNRVNLFLDNTVSREAPATIIYEPRKREFHLIPKYDTSTMLYLNGELLSEKVILNSGDVIGIGDTDLMLVALCGPQFAWEDLAAQGAN